MKEIFINCDAEDNEIFVIEDGILKEKYSDFYRKNRIEGNIYIGRIQNIVPGLQAAFVDIGENKNAFIHLKDILPKVDLSEEKSVPDYDSMNIKDYVKQGMPILVEIKRDSYDKKGARASTHINLAGRFLVLLPNSSFVTISQKIEDLDERERLINIVKKLLPNGMGAIIRTGARDKKEDEICYDLESLVDKWNQIVNIEFDSDSIPKIIYKNFNIVDKIIVGLIDNGLDRIVVNSREIEKYVRDCLKKYNKSEIEVEYRDENLLGVYDLEKQKEMAENRKIWLKSGGFITIDKTEALTAIDVNSGKYIGKKGLDATALAVDKEAAVEIAKQIRLRDIGGIIVIDFIDLNNDNSRDEIIKIFQNELKNDRSKVQIEGFTKLDLLELTRKHFCSN